MIRRSVYFAVLLAAAWAALAGDPSPACPATKDECQLQIRSMLQGKKYLGAKLQETKAGVVVSNVVPESPAERAGLAVGDRVIIVDGHDVAKARVRTIKEILDRSKENRRILIIVIRNGALKTIRPRLEVMSKDQIDKVVASHLRDAHGVRSAQK